ncbi:MAG: ABC transporter ATP-binding protein [Vulcanimicrobiaceae bacterium]
MLQVDRIAKDFGNVHAVREVSFSIASGSTFGLLGPNGAGKTTTMRMILGILTPDAGSIAWNGKKIDGKSRRRFGYFPEERGLYGKMKVCDQIAYFGRLHGLREPTLTPAVHRWIERLGLSEYIRRPCAELSKGNQQKVQMACACVHEPEFLILDEPFSGLDPVNADTLLAVFNEMKRAGTTLVLSSHQMWQLEALCDRFCIIADGCNRVEGSLAELRAAWPTRVLRVAPQSDRLAQILDALPDTQHIQGADGTFEYVVRADADFAAILRSLVQADAVTAFEAVEPSLHEIYLHAIGEGAAA